MRQGMLVATLVLLVAGCSRLTCAEEGKALPLPPHIVQAWAAAGAKVGWVGLKDGSLQFSSEQAGLVGVLPAFRLETWRDGMVSKLPAPEAPFALVVPARTRVTAAELKELVGLKGLQYLDLFATRVADAALKELAVLKNLQRLDLGRTQVTDAGLKELVGLKSLESLAAR